MGYRVRRALLLIQHNCSLLKADFPQMDTNYDRPARVGSLISWNNACRKITQPSSPNPVMFPRRRTASCQCMVSSSRVPSSSKNGYISRATQCHESATLPDVGGFAARWRAYMFQPMRRAGGRETKTLTRPSIASVERLIICRVRVDTGELLERFYHMAEMTDAGAW